MERNVSMNRMFNLKYSVSPFKKLNDTGQESFCAL